MLSRDVRRQARREGGQLNLWDVGRRRNLVQIFDPDGDEPWYRWFWPGGRAGGSDMFAGHVFEHSAGTLAELREMTIDLRYGEP